MGKRFAERMEMLGPRRVALPPPLCVAPEGREGPALCCLWRVPTAGPLSEGGILPLSHRRDLADTLQAIGKS